MNPQITDTHLSKPAYVYVRQSTLKQVRHNQESTERQYALQNKALTLGWTRQSVRVLDGDLGHSGAKTGDRQDFKTLVSDVAMGHVGAVFALEVSRLARSNVDWHRLLELCALTHTLVIDADGCYDPADFNDGLLLGLKGTMAQAELHFLRGRLQGGKLNKACKGELRFLLPVGLCYDDQGCIVLDPDDEVRGAVQLVFTLFRETGSAYAVVQHFAQSGLRFPKRTYGGAWHGKLIWGRLTHGRVLGVLKNPSYAGVYAFGRHKGVTSVTAEGLVHKTTRILPAPDWRVRMSEHHEGYITEEEFEHNVRCLAANKPHSDDTLLGGAAREGLAMLQGLLLCGTCGRALTVRYQGNGGIYPIYECTKMRREGRAGEHSFSVSTDLLDDPVCKAALEALKPEELKLALAAVDEIEQRDQAIMRQWHMRIERAEYECALAERRYEEVDPSNRLVAATLERRWNEALSRVDEVRAEASRFQARNARVLTPEQRARILALAQDLPRVWQAPTTSAKDRKRMLRLLIADITVENLAPTRQVLLHIRWHGGACTDIMVARRQRIADRRRYPAQTVERIRQLSSDMTMTDAQVAQTLNAEGVHSQSGQPFRLEMIRWIRYHYGIPAPRLQRSDEITVKQLADELGVSIYFVHYWIQHGVIAARRLGEYHPWWLTVSEQQRQELQELVKNSGHIQGRNRKAQL
jgi:DNA invertase Pin-like site-specific DNA recombinase